MSFQRDVMMRPRPGALRQRRARLSRPREEQVGVPALRSTDYINTIPPEREPWFPGDEEVECCIRAFIRWNAAVMVSSANRKGLQVGGHIVTYQSSASLYEVGFNHFFRGKDHDGGGYEPHIEGHGSPGIYSRALEGRLSEEQLYRFRQEVQHGKGAGLLVRPRPRASCWTSGVQRPWASPPSASSTRPASTATSTTVASRTSCRAARAGPSWATARWPRPESLGAIRVAAREELDNLTWDHRSATSSSSTARSRQRQDHPGARGQLPRAGWDVIKVVWVGSGTTLLARDVDGVLVNRMTSCCMVSSETDPP